jgi:hypothetical protein
MGHSSGKNQNLHLDNKNNKTKSRKECEDKKA